MTSNLRFQPAPFFSHNDGTQCVRFELFLEELCMALKYTTDKNVIQSAFINPDFRFQFCRIFQNVLDLQNIIVFPYFNLFKI